MSEPAQRRAPSPATAQPQPSAPSSKSPSTPGVPRPLATDADRKALASVTRLRIVRMCSFEALTNKEIADRLGAPPARVLHHVRTLVDNGFLDAEPARRGRRGAREVPYRSTGKSWRLDMGQGGEIRSTVLDTFVAELTAAPPGEIVMTRLGLQLRAEEWQELQDRLAGLLDEFAARGADPDGARWSVFLAVHPDSNQAAPDSNHSASPAGEDVARSQPDAGNRSP